MKIAILTAADGATWEAEWVTAFASADAGVEIVRRCVDVVELLAVAATGQARAALVAASMRRLDVDAVDRLIASGVRPIAVLPRADAHAEERVRALGIEHVVPDDAAASVVASVVVDALSRPVHRPAAARAFADPIAEPMSVDAPAEIESPTPAARRGSVVAVWGPTGAPGRTTVAVTLADEIARLGASAMLVDADVYGGVIASVLGILDESPGLAAACRVAGGGRLDADSLARLCWQVSPGLRVLTGIALPQRWPEIRAAAIEAVLDAARQLADWTVVDCGFAVETDEEISFDSLAPRRNGATLAVLDCADEILVVGSADPIGLQRLVRALGDLSDAEVTTPARVVLNRVRRGGAGRDPSAEVASALERFTGRTADVQLPLDQESLDAALMTGRTLGEAAAGSGLRRAVVELARGMTGIESRSSRRSSSARRSARRSARSSGASARMEGHRAAHPSERRP
jgi:Flp pilus assembly CpaE family ATPase